jgi:hypothetical protein
MRASMTNPIVAASATAAVAAEGDVRMRRSVISHAAAGGGGVHAGAAELLRAPSSEGGALAAGARGSSVVGALIGADRADWTGLERSFDLQKFFAQLCIHMLFPLSIPFVLCTGGLVRLKNQRFCFVCPAAGTPERWRQLWRNVYSCVVWQWIPPLALVALVATEVADGRTDERDLGRLEHSVHPMLLLSFVVVVARYSVVSIKYAYLTDAEYLQMLCNPDEEQQRRDLRKLQLLSAWTDPNALVLNSALDVRARTRHTCTVLAFGGMLSDVRVGCFVWAAVRHYAGGCGVAVSRHRRARASRVR